MSGSVNNVSAQHHKTFYGSLWFVVLITAGYGLLHSVLRIMLAPAIGQDDVIANLYVQSLEWGYNKRQPPLYEWLLWPVQQVTGPTLPSFLIVKYILLIITAGFIYQCAKRILGDRIWAVIAAFSLSLCYQVGWNIHEGVTHTAVLMAVISGTLWAFLRVIDYGRLSDYALFGVFVGAGFLSKYSFAAFLAMLLFAALLQKPIRQKLSLAGFAISVVIAAILVLPFALWLIQADQGLTALSGKALRSAELNYWQALLRGLPASLYAPLEFLLPLLLILPIAFPGMVKTSIGAVRDHVPSDRIDLQKLLLHMFVIGIVFLVAAVVFTGSNRILSRYMHPFALVFVIWLVAQVQKTVITRSETQHGVDRLTGRYFVVLVSCAFLVVGLRIANLVVAEPLCKACRQLVPYEGLAQAMRQGGFPSSTDRPGLIITLSRHDGGNLRKHFPGTWIACLNNPRYLPPAQELEVVDQVAIVWPSSKKNPKLPNRAGALIKDLGFTGEVTIQKVLVPWRHLWRDPGYRTSQWYYAVFDRKVAE